MKRFITFPALLLALLYLLTGCASTYYGQGKTYLQKDDYPAAIQAFLLELKQDRNNISAWRELGIAYYKNGEYEKGVNALEQAYRLSSDDGATIYYMGASLEKINDLDGAIGYYRQYAKVSRMSKMRSKIEAKLEELSRRRMQQQVQDALQNERNIDVASIPDNTLAVLYFQNLGSSQELTPLEKGLTDMLITDLSQVQSLSVVERVKLQKLMEEMGLGMTGLVDERTAPRVGKLLGSRKLVKGTFIDLDEKNLRIDAGMIGTDTGQLQPAGKITGELERFFRLEKNLAFNIIDEMGIKLSEEERNAILYIPTESLLAFLAYSKGLDYEDRGMYQQANIEYNKAVQIDPNFSMAQKRLDVVEVIETGDIDLGDIEQASYSEAGNRSETIDTRSRLENSSVQIDAGFIPSIDSREPVSERSNTQGFGSGIPVEIEIGLPR